MVLQGVGVPDEALWADYYLLTPWTSFRFCFSNNLLFFRHREL